MRVVLSVVLALGVVVVAAVWVSDVRFKDGATFTDCGVPLGAAWHGREAPDPALLHPLPPGQSEGVFRVPIGTRLTETVCAGEARTRVAIAAGAIVLAFGGVVLSRRRWGRSPPNVALV